MLPVDTWNTLVQLTKECRIGAALVAFGTQSGPSLAREDAPRLVNGGVRLS